jgi:gliding motility-associated-like protein
MISQILRKILVLPLLLGTVLCGFGQVVTECPQNIGFENGDFKNWVCSVGEISGTGQMFPGAVRPAVISMFTSGAANPANQQLLKSGQGLVDPYGKFPLDAPNGSNYIVRLGNNSTGRGAESISYTLTVPTNVDNYSIIFNYAVVIENPPHEVDEQPKFTARILDVASNSTTSCGSFTFTAPGSGATLPGFELSALRGSRGDPVFYKPWAPVLVNLTDYRGKTIRLEFTTNDCSRGGHFGYAYIDFNENCSIPITGNITCQQSASITLRTLPGFLSYNWYNVQTGVSYGTEDSIVLSPLPPVGTKIGVELVPYAELGCTQTLYTIINDMSLAINDPPPDCTSVDITPTSITVGNSSDLTYTYWRNSNATVPIPDPKHITVGGTYYIKAVSSSGCSLVKEVHVNIIPPPDLIITPPAGVTYPGTVDITATFTHDPGITYSYWTTSDATVRLPTPTKIGKKGTYYIKAINSTGCISVKPVTVEILIDDIVIPNTFTPNGDGVNDVLTVLINSKINIKFFRIYNRWGTLVYETPDISNYWAGFKENAMVPVGTYYWVIQGDENSKIYRRSGYVTVIR